MGTSRGVRKDRDFVGLKLFQGRCGWGNRARPTRPHTNPASTFCVTLGRYPCFPEPQFTHLYTRELDLMLPKGPPA